MTLQNDSPTETRTAKYDWVLLTLLALSLGSNVLLAVAAFRQGAPVAAAAPPVSLKAGTMLPPVQGQRVGGGTETLAWDASGRPTLIYVFTPTCQWCAKNFDNIKALIDGVKDSHRVIGVSLDPDVAAYIAEAGYDFPVYVNPSAAMFSSYGLGSTPQTLLVEPTGKLTKSWVGAFVGPVQQEIEDTFSIRLPGLLAANQAAVR